MSRAADTLDLAATDLVTFRLGGEVLAVPALHLREILEPVPVTRVPGAPPFVPGLLNVRGAVVPLADLRIPLQMPRPSAEAGHDDATRILVLELPLNGQDAVVGILADSVHEVTRIGADQLERIPPVGTRWPPRFVAAVGRWGGDFVTIPDLTAIFAEFLTGPSGRSPQSGAVAAPSEMERPQCV